jgi:hypothetical protein
MKAPDPGIYHNVEFATYCDWDAVNNSSLGSALRSGLHYCHAQEAPRKDTDAFRFGRLAHEGRLEPAAMLDRYAVMPDLTAGILVNGSPAKNTKATKEYRERVAKWHEENSGREVIEQDRFDDIKGVLNALWSHERSRTWFTSMGPSEVSIVWDDATTGLRCKARIDKIVSDTLLADMKTTRDATRFESAIHDYGYDRQAAFYLDGWRAVTGQFAQFAFAAVESEAPHGVRAAPASAGVIVSGRRKYQEALKVVAALRAGELPTGYEQPDEFDLPAWKRRQSLVLTVGGEPVEVSS